MDLLFDPVILLLGIHSNELKTLIQKNISTLCSLQHYLQLPKYESNPSVHQQISVKATMRHLHNGILLDHKKKKVLSFATVWVDLENIMLSYIIQAEKKSTIWFYSYVESNQQSKLTGKIETDSRWRAGWQLRRKRVRSEGIEQKRKKDSWTWTTVCWLHGEGDVRGLNGNEKIP